MTGRRVGMIWKVRQNTWKPPIRQASPEEVAHAARNKKRLWRQDDAA